MPNGTYSSTGEEKIPDNWSNRVTPYTDEDAGAEILAQYLEYPVLFGGATGDGTFDLLPHFGYIKGGKLSVPQTANVASLLYQLVAERVPSGLNTVIAPTLDALNIITSKDRPLPREPWMPSTAHVDLTLVSAVKMSFE
jgi:hypothetical protein